jgi:hypothetical protein
MKLPGFKSIVGFDSADRIVRLPIIKINPIEMAAPMMHHTIVRRIISTAVPNAFSQETISTIPS